MRTGAGDGPWVDIEKPKPSPVRDIYAYWSDPPPTPSERCQYWLRQIERGWRPNRRISIESRDGQAVWYGIYMWELIHVLWPAMEPEPGTSNSS